MLYHFSLNACYLNFITWLCSYFINRTDDLFLDNVTKHKGQQSLSNCHYNNLTHSERRVTNYRCVFVASYTRHLGVI